MHPSAGRRIAPRVALTGLVLAALVGALTAAPAQAAPAADLFCAAPGQELAISPISGLQDGQQVTWLSTIKGTTPTEFTGEYIGKLENGLGYDAAGQPRDLLLVRLDGDVVTGAGSTLAAGVWAGASGSPVYDAAGALIGAVSYGFSNLADDVAGVTPAAYMKEIGQLPTSRTLNAADRKTVAKLAGTPVARAAAPASLRQLPTVRVTMGTSAATLDGLGTRLAEKIDGYRPAKAPGLAIAGGASDGADYPIVAGGNIAVSYAYGAVGAASVGTVTAVCGDQVFAFGHPNNWNSALASNFHGASAARIVPDLGSYKLVSAVGKVKGAISDDRLAGVRGTLGTAAATVPVTTVSYLGDLRSKATSHVSAVPLVGPAAAAQVATDAARMLDNQMEGTAKLTWWIDYTRENGTRGTLSNTNRYSSAEALGDFMGWDLSEDIAQLQMNPFEDVSIDKVTVRTRFEEGYRAGRLTGVEMKKGSTWKKVSAGSTTSVTRGKTYTFRAVLSPAPGTERVTVYREFSISVPKTLKNRMSVTLRPPAGEPDFEGAPVGDFDALVAALDANRRSDTLDLRRTFTANGSKRYVRTGRMSTPTVVIDGKAFSFKIEVPATRSSKR